MGFARVLGLAELTDTASDVFIAIAVHLCSLACRNGKEKLTVIRGWGGG